MKKKLFNLKMAVLTMGVFLSTAVNAQFTAVASGDWSSSTTWGGTAPSSTVTSQNITIPSGITVNLDQNVTFSGIVNTFLVNGVLTSTSSSEVHMTSGNLSGTGTVSINKLKFSSLGSISYAGVLNLKTMINSVMSLAFTSVANITDTLELENGNLALNTNGNLTMASGSTVKVGNGSLVINSGVFNSGNAYNVMYIGTTKTAGAELNSVTIQNVYLNMNTNSIGVLLANNTIINGDLKLTSGRLDLNGKRLTLKGDLVISSGSTIDSDNTSDLVIEGSGTFTSALMFAAGSSIHDLTINRINTGQVKLGSAINVAGHLNLNEGNLTIENTGTLTMNAASTIHIEKGNLSNSGFFIGTAQYNVEYAGTSDATSGVELTGAGLTNLMINYASGSNKVILSNNALVGGKFELLKGKMDLNGKTLLLAGTFYQSTSSWITGSSTSELHLNLTSVTQDSLYFDNTNAASQTLNKLKINTGGSNSIILGSKLIVNSELSFMMGKIALGNGDLEIAPTASITGYDDTKYVVTSENGSGVLIQSVSSGAAYVTFPVGLSSNYSPAYVQQTSAGTTGNFSAKCHSLPASATLKAVNRTWMIEAVGVTNINANLKLGWKATEEMNSFNRTNAYISHYTSAMWDVSASAGATAGAHNTFELSRTGLTSLSPFAVVENGQPLKVSELSKLDGLEIYPNPSNDVLNIKLLNNSDEYHYELIDLTGRTIQTASNANPVNKFDISGLESGCYFIKITNLADNKSLTKRFVKQ